MTHLKRLLWLAAWSVWLWLGFGLYRELPRDLGPVVSRPRLEADEGVWGLLPNGAGLLTEPAPDPVSGRHIRLRSLANGTAAYTVSLNRFEDNGLGFVMAPSHGLVVGQQRRGAVRPGERLLILDAAAGRWREIPFVAGVPALHNERRWALFTDLGGEGRIGTVVLIDLDTGVRLFERDSTDRNGESWDVADHAVFAADDRVVVPMRTRDSQRFEASHLEVWSLTSRALIHRWPAAVVQMLKVSWPIAAWYGDHLSNFELEVFDLESGRRLPAIERDPEHENPNGLAPAAVSANGRTVLSPWAAQLWDIPAGVLLWAGGDGDEVTVALPERFEVAEKWRLPWKLVDAEATTYTVRRMSDGSVEYRCKQPTLSDAEGRFYFSREHQTVHSFPPCVNWPLLALCQIILALPLVLLWALLRWRRRRAARRQPAVATHPAAAP